MKRYIKNFMMAMMVGATVFVCMIGGSQWMSR